MFYFSLGIFMEDHTQIHGIKINIGRKETDKPVVALTNILYPVFIWFMSIKWKMIKWEWYLQASFRHLFGLADQL